jgi:hypothetical protein
MADETDNKEAGTPSENVNIAELPHFRSPQHTTVYANFAECGSSPWDIRINFCEVGEAESGVPGIIDRATVILPPAVANALVGIIQETLKNYSEYMRAAKAEAEARKKAASAQKAQNEGAVVDATEKPLAG